MKKFKKHFEERLHGRNYDPSMELLYDDIVKPIFARDIWIQTLNEMGFKYVVCSDDLIPECIALALKLKCPLVGNNLQYFFSQVEYIPELNTTLDENMNLQCGMYTLSSFLRRRNLTEDKIILFLMLTDELILEQQVFQSFFKSNKMLNRYDRLNPDRLLTWLTKRSTEQVEKEIFNVLSKSDQVLYKEKKTNLEKLTQERKKSDTKFTHYVTDKNKAKFAQSDPDWFEKGVFLEYIATPYVTLYRYKVVKASNFIEDYEQENSIMVSIDIVKYAFDLLTNFEGGKMNVELEKSDSSHEVDQTLKYGLSIRKPDYEATLSVFENGWDNIKELNLLKHFITESLQSFDFARLDGAPADSKLFLIALMYFSRKKPEAKLEIYGILLSYIMLGVVFVKLDIDANDFKSKKESVSEKPLIDSFTDKDLVTAADCEVAGSLMSEYFQLREDERCIIFDRKVLHPLVEFTRCLEELNYLNQLCGSEFNPTIYRKTFNGTFIYRVLYVMKGQDGLEFIKKKLNPAPTVLAFFTGILRIYESIFYEY
ncbi:protein asteroid-like [Maniola hyperantus]|uniref:protein asteroid-like n=1 Tax=Aphantopus hyperantus TaxID=2795564 RepID=UPI00374A454C